MPKLSVSQVAWQGDWKLPGEKISSEWFAAGESLRLLLVTPRYLPDMGGVQNHVYQVGRRLACAGVDVTVLTTNPGKRLPAEERMEGVTIRRVPAWPPRRDYYFAPSMMRLIMNGSWDIVHVQSYHTLVPPLAMLAARLAGIPYVVTFHGGGHSSRMRNALRGLQQQLLRPLLARASRLIAVAGFEIPFYSRRLRLPAAQFALIPNGGDLPLLPAQSPAEVDEGLIVSIGRLERYKGHQRVIDALPQVLARRPDVRLWIAGTGPYESSLRALAQRLDVADRVKICAIPADERETLARELSKAALVVLFSDYETHPIAVLEALQLGRPVLTTDTSGLRELAQRGLTRAIPLDSTSTQVATAILNALEQPSTTSKSPPAKAMNLPTWDECATDLLALYQDVASTARRASCVS